MYSIATAKIISASTLFLEKYSIIETWLYIKSVFESKKVIYYLNKEPLFYKLEVYIKHIIR